MSQATRDKTREQLERARFASQAEDERARTMREVMNGPARQERIKRQNHQELEDRNARYLDRKASFYEEQHRAKNAWDAESAMESARGQMIGALRTEAVRPVLSGRAAAAAAVVVGEPAHPWEQQHQPPHRQQSSATANQRSYMYDDELASGSELPPVRRSGGPLSTPGGTNHGAHQPLDAWGSPGTEMGSASHGSGTHHPATDGYPGMLPIYRKTLRGAGKLQSAAVLPHLSTRARPIDAAILYSPYTNAFPVGGPPPLACRRPEPRTAHAYGYGLADGHSHRVPAAAYGQVGGRALAEPHDDFGLAQHVEADNFPRGSAAADFYDGGLLRTAGGSSRAGTSEGRGHVSHHVGRAGNLEGRSAERGDEGRTAQGVVSSAPSAAQLPPIRDYAGRKGRGLPAHNTVPSNLSKPMPQRLAQHGATFKPIGAHAEPEPGASTHPGMSRSASAAAVLATKGPPKRPERAADVAAAQLMDAIAQEEGWM